MIEWDDYINQLILSETDFDNISISLDENSTSTVIPPIIKVSISILDKMIEHQSRLNILVFPEKIQLVFIFTLMKLFHNISQGKIKTNYDPTGFTVGEKIKVGNAIVEYLGVETRGNRTCLMIKLADLDKISAPIDFLPIFQKVETRRHLSKHEQYIVAKREALAVMQGKTCGSKKISYISEMKTHMESSIFTMTSLAAIREQIASCTIDGKKVTKIFHIAQVDYEGNISNISPGQMSGVPAIVFASDLYAIREAVNKGASVQSIIIDGSNTNSILNQLDALDELIRLNIPIVCMTDIANSFDLESFSARGFNVWRWNQENLTEKLYDVVPLSSDKKVKNCAKQSIEYIELEGKEISKAMKLLALHRRETEDQSPQMMRLFEMLNTMIFSALRTTTELSEMDIEKYTHTLEECSNILNAESKYLDKRIVSDYSNIIFNLKNVYCKSFVFEKNKALKKILRNINGAKIYLIIPEKSPKSQVQKYWDNWTVRSRSGYQVKVLFPSEYYSLPINDTDTTVICGWMRRAIMRKLIFSFNTSQYVILLYDYENKWKNYDAVRWGKAIKSSSNNNIIENMFSSEEAHISNPIYNQAPLVENEEKEDELSEIELIIRDNKFKRYINNGAHGSKEIVAAIPISFMGGYLAFYRAGHKVISATKIISSLSDKIETVLPSELAVGDFIVVRETDRDIIRELADVILKNSKKGELREKASKWREVLSIELLFCSIDDLYQKLKTAGCDKGLQTIRRWIEDEDVIAPRSKDDLKILANVTENEMLLEMLDSIYEAAQEVRNAHLLAGRKLSEQLKLTLAEEIKKYGYIDTFNFWEPIDMEIEDIGTVKVLKIIDIGSEVDVSNADTNRLIED